MDGYTSVRPSVCLSSVYLAEILHQQSLVILLGNKNNVIIYFFFQKNKPLLTKNQNKTKKVHFLSHFQTFVVKQTQGRAEVALLGCIRDPKQHLFRRTQWASVFDVDRRQNMEQQSCSLLPVGSTIIVGNNNQQHSNEVRAAHWFH